MKTDPLLINWLESGGYDSLPPQGELRTRIGSLIIKDLDDVKLAKHMLRVLKKHYAI